MRGSRLQAVPFWLVERVRSQSETGARRNKREESGGETLFPASPQAPLHWFAPVFSGSAISRDLSTIQKGAACSLARVLRIKTHQILQFYFTDLSPNFLEQDKDTYGGSFLYHLEEDSPLVAVGFVVCI